MAEEIREEPTGPSPSDIKQIDETTLGITWTDGHESVHHGKLFIEEHGDSVTGQAIAQVVDNILKFIKNKSN